MTGALKTKKTAGGDRSGAPPSNLDAGFILSRLEKGILEGKNSEKVLEVIQKESLWQRLGIEDRLKWAELAQMAEDTRTARLILDGLNREQPTCTEAWEQHLALLSIVGTNEAFAALLARARPHIDASRFQTWSRPRNATGSPDEKDIQAAVDPFEKQQSRMIFLRRFMDLFAGRPDCFARQWADRSKGKHGYVPERRSMSPADIEEHLKGIKTYGIYLLQADGLVKTAVIDANLKKEFRTGAIDAERKRLVRREAVHLIARMKELAEAGGGNPIVEFSGGKGYHFWYFFNMPLPASHVRAALRGIVEQVMPDLTAYNLEVFPKQDRVGGKGFGNLVKLPLGIHRLTGKRSHFIECTNHGVDAQLDFLASVKYSDLREMTKRLDLGQSVEVVVHPRWKAWA